MAVFTKIRGKFTEICVVRLLRERRKDVRTLKYRTTMGKLWERKFELRKKKSDKARKKYREN
jgi:hypothetical protein